MLRTVILKTILLTHILFLLKKTFFLSGKLDKLCHMQSIKYCIFLYLHALQEFK